MYTYSDVVEIGKAQDVIMATKYPTVDEDASIDSLYAADEFDE
jgi:hypothetical protein